MPEPLTPQLRLMACLHHDSTAASRQQGCSNESVTTHSHCYAVDFRLQLWHMGKACQSQKLLPLVGSQMAKAVFWKLSWVSGSTYGALATLHSSLQEYASWLKRRRNIFGCKRVNTLGRLRWGLEGHSSVRWCMTPLLSNHAAASKMRTLRSMGPQSCRRQLLQKRSNSEQSNT